MFAKNHLSSPAQFSFAADLFMMQALLKSRESQDSPGKLEYVFPRSCFRQVIQLLLDSDAQPGFTPFEGVRTRWDAAQAWVTFPDEREQDKMQRFFEAFNQKRGLAQGNKSFPPLPDLYQGQAEPDVYLIRRYSVLIAEAFDGETDAVQVPTGPDGAESTFHCA